MNECIPPMEQQSALSAKKTSHFGKLHVYLEIHVVSHFLPLPEKISVFCFKMDPGDYCQNWEHLLKLGLWDRAWGAGDIV